MGSEAVFERALEQNEQRLTKLPNVVGLGIVDNPQGKGLAVAVYVSEKIPKEKLKRNDRIPKRLTTQFGRQRRWVPVTVIEQGIVELESIGE